MALSERDSVRPGISDLDSTKTYLELDPTGLRDRLKKLPDQCRAAWAASQAMKVPDGWRTVDRVVIGGMGGSAIAGDLVSDLASLQQSVPVALVRDFSLPFKLDDRSLFVACSYSGATEETLALFRQALGQGVPILAITSGGALARHARASGTPSLNINVSGEPRSAVGYNLMLLLGALDRAGVLAVSDDEVQRAITAMGEQIDRCSEEVPTPVNPAKLLARELVDKLVVIYGGGLFSAMARRWKTQLNENAKAWAFFETLPELLHNSVEAYQSPLVSVQVLLLQPNAAGNGLKDRYEAIVELLGRGNIPHRVLKAEDGTPLAQLLSMLALGDYVSYYLALLKGLDPSPTPVLQLGKDLLAGSSY